MTNYILQTCYIMNKILILDDEMTEGPTKKHFVAKNTGVENNYA